MTHHSKSCRVSRLCIDTAENRFRNGNIGHIREKNLYFRSDFHPHRIILLVMRCQIFQRIYRFLLASYLLLIMQINIFKHRTAQSTYIRLILPIPLTNFQYSTAQSILGQSRLCHRYGIFRDFGPHLRDAYDVLSVLRHGTFT